MEAPTGQRFCVVRTQRADIKKRANSWPDIRSNFRLPTAAQVLLDVDSERAGNPDCRFEAIRTTTQPIGPIAKVVERVQCHPVRIEARGQGVGTVGVETVKPDDDPGPTISRQ